MNEKPLGEGAPQEGNGKLLLSVGLGDCNPRDHELQHSRQGHPVRCRCRP